MKNSELTNNAGYVYSNGKFNGHNLTFTIESPGNYASVDARIYFNDQTRKNSPYKDYRAINIYVEKINSNHGTEAKYLTDLMIHLERMSQWIIEGYAHKL